MITKSIEKIGEGLPFDINPVSDKLVMEAHGIDEEQVDGMMDSYITQMNAHVKLSEMEPGKSMRTAALNRNYETSQGPKDILLYMYIENIGKTQEEELNSLEGMIIKVEIVEVDEVSDTYLDFMSFIRELNKEQV